MEFQYDDKSEGVGSMYIKHHHKLGKFVDASGEVLELSTFALCPDSVKTGLGRYSQEAGYEFIWDEKTGVPNPEMEKYIKDGYTKAFQCNVYTPELGVMLYQRYQLLEWNEWYRAMKVAWSASDFHKDRVAVFKYVGSEPVGNYGNYKPNLEFVKWADRPEGFVTVEDNDPFVNPDNTFGGEPKEDDTSDIPF
jgi:hypothetical protein